MLQLPVIEHPGIAISMPKLLAKLFSFRFWVHLQVASGEQAPDHNNQHEHHKHQQQAQTQQLEYAQCAFLAAGCG
jgi:hypothetical protein